MPWEEQTIHGGSAENTALYGCIFCRTGSEGMLIREITRTHPGIRALMAEKLIRRRIKGEMHEEKQILFPGYVFFRTEGEISEKALMRWSDAFILLRNDDHSWALRGSDEEFARWLFEQDGVIGFSEAYYDEGDRIRIISGPMMGMEGRITRVNRRFMSGQVTLTFRDREIAVWLGFDLVERK